MSGNIAVGLVTRNQMQSSLSEPLSHIRFREAIHSMNIIWVSIPNLKSKQKRSMIKLLSLGFTLGFRFQAPPIIINNLFGGSLRAIEGWSALAIREEDLTVPSSDPSRARPVLDQ